MLAVTEYHAGQGMHTRELAAGLKVIATGGTDDEARAAMAQATQQAVTTHTVARSKARRRNAFASCRAKIDTPPVPCTRTVSPGSSRGWSSVPGG